MRPTRFLFCTVLAAVVFAGCARGAPTFDQVADTCSPRPMFLFVNVGPADATASQRQRQVAQLITRLKTLVTRPGSSGLEVMVAPLTDESTAAPVTQVTIPCVPPAGTDPDDPAVQRELQRLTPIQRGVTTQQLKDHKRAVTGAQQDVDDALNHVVKLLNDAPGFPESGRVSVWGGLRLATKTIADLPQAPHLVVVLAEDEVLPKGMRDDPDFREGCCSVGHGPLVWLGMRSATTADELKRREQWSFFLKNVEGVKSVQFFAANEPVPDLATLLDATARR